jgi:hypothetical protein
VNITAPLTDVGYGEREDYELHKTDLPGKVVLSDEGVREGHRFLHRSERLALAIEYGAAALMIASSADGLLRTGLCYTTESPIASMGISGEDGLLLRQRMAQGKSPLANIVMTNSMSTGTARNVLAEIPGSDDAGAIDNGVGVAIVLDTARALAACGKRPRRTIRFALWAGEEIGLLGSRDYVERHADELDKLAALINLDGTGAPYAYNTEGRKQPAQLLRDLVRQLAPLGMRDDFTSGVWLHSDHQDFMLAGVPTLTLMSGVNEAARGVYHTAKDTFDKVSLPALCHASAVTAHTLWALADEPQRSFERHTPAQVDQMIDEFSLREELAVDSYYDTQR